MGGAGGTDPWGGTDLRQGHFLVKMYAKMKELGPMGGAGHAPWICQCIRYIKVVKNKRRHFNTKCSTMAHKVFPKRSHFSGGSRISHRGGMHPLGGRGPLTWALFSENVCENERIGSHRGACARHAPPDPPMHFILSFGVFLQLIAVLTEEHSHLFAMFMSGSHTLPAGIVTPGMLPNSSLFQIKYSSNHFLKRNKI